jgi:hypothetical protein
LLVRAYFAIDCRMRAIGFVLLALLSCLTMAAAVNGALRIAKPQLFVASWKLRAAVADPRTNVVFFGTSRIEHGIIPNVFDAAMADAGISEVHSYNAGVAASALPEVIHQIEEFYSPHPKNIKYIIFEPNIVMPAVITQNNTFRTIEYFDIIGAYRIFKFINGPMRDLAFLSPENYLESLLGGLLRHYLSIGLTWVTPDGPDGTIYNPSASGFPDLYPRARLSFSGDDHYRDLLGRMAKGKPNLSLISDEQIELALALAAFIRSQGAEPVIVRAPQTEHIDLDRALDAILARRCTGRAPLILDFGSPAQYPELFAEGNRMDADHLNAAGAAIFTRLVANQLAHAVRNGDIARPLCELKAG